jgi:hypothetical protein
MRSLLAIGLLCLACVLAGCDSGQSMLTNDEMENNPKAGLDALNKMGPMPTRKTAMPSPSTKK